MNFSMNAHAHACIVNVGIIAVVAFAVWFTHSAMPLWALLLLYNSTTKSAEKA